MAAFEVLLPLQFNDGGDVRNCLQKRFCRSLSILVPPVTRLRESKVFGGMLVRDNLVKIVVDAPDLISNRLWMRQYKEEWRMRLDQLELWMTSYAVEVE